jgi:LPXTG-motif cell wall-anchored protein
MLTLNGKEEPRMTPHTIQAIAGALAAAVLGLIVYRRKQKNA